MTKYLEAKTYFTDLSDKGIVQADELFEEAENVRSYLGDIAYARFIINCYEDLFTVQIPNIQKGTING
jgi:hypothetical protein